MAQAVAELVPRVRRALEGARPLASDDPLRLTDDQAEAAAADAIGDIILYTHGRWGHILLGTNGPPATHWSVEPGLTTAEEALVAAQAALTQFVYVLKDMKVSERIQNESQQWEWAKSATAMRDLFALLKAQRDAALQALVDEEPVLARFVSIVAVRDRLHASFVEPWTIEAGMGGLTALNPVPFGDGY